MQFEGEFRSLLDFVRFRVVLVHRSFSEGEARPPPRLRLLKRDDRLYLLKNNLQVLHPKAQTQFRSFRTLSFFANSVTAYK